jgi:hypothetical protein
MLLARRTKPHERRRVYGRLVPGLQDARRGRRCRACKMQGDGDPVGREFRTAATRTATETPSVEAATESHPGTTEPATKSRDLLRSEAAVAPVGGPTAQTPVGVVFEVPEGPTRTPSADCRALTRPSTFGTDPRKCTERSSRTSTRASGRRAFTALPAGASAAAERGRAREKSPSFGEVCPDVQLNFRRPRFPRPSGRYPFDFPALEPPRPRPADGVCPPLHTPRGHAPLLECFT